MKAYPSIIGAAGKSFQEINLHTFDKVDGSNLRFEINKKGWYKYGTRKRLFDETDEVFGCAISLFHSTIAGDLERIIRSQNWERAVVFCEFWGKNSFAGLHDPNDEKHLTVIDVAPYKRDILPPKEFVKLFGDLGPKYLGKIKWTRGFIQEVISGKVEGITFEGLVGKTEHKRSILMYKIKTAAWIEKVKQLYAPEEAAKIIES